LVDGIVSWHGVEHWAAIHDIDIQDIGRSHLGFVKKSNATILSGGILNFTFLSNLMKICSTV